MAASTASEGRQNKKQVEPFVVTVAILGHTDQCQLEAKPFVGKLEDCGWAVLT